MSRRTDYSDALANKICDLLAGGKSLVQICACEDMPARSTVLLWMQEKADFAAKITRAREHGQADFLFDDLARIENAVETGALDPNAARVLISSKQWRAMKLAPKKYGDKTYTETQSTVTVQTTRKLDISALSDDQLDALEIALRETLPQLTASPRMIEQD